MLAFVYFSGFLLYFAKIAHSDYVHYEDIDGSVKLHQEQATWRDARVKCHEEGGVLASPETEELLSAMTAVMGTSSRPPRVFTGIHDTYAKGSFHSLQGTPLAHIPTELSVDSGSDAESCLVMYLDGTLAKNNCADTLPFVCYKREPSCLDGYKYSSQTGSCYKVYNEKITWKNPFAACAADGAHLAVVNSLTEATVLKNLMPSSFERISIGFLDWKNHNLWMTIDGKTLKEAGYDKWGSGEPNNYNGVPQNCGGLQADGSLDDLCCDQEEYHFICEKAPDMGQKARILKHLDSCPRTKEPLCIVC